jgi:hypothetical protein
VVAAVISAANELNQARATLCGVSHGKVVIVLQALQSDSLHLLPPMLLAFRTRTLRDDRWLVH